MDTCQQCAVHYGSNKNIHIYKLKTKEAWRRRRSVDTPVLCSSLSSEGVSVSHAEPRDHEPRSHLPDPGAAASQPLASILRIVLRCCRQETTHHETNRRWRKCTLNNIKYINLGNRNFSL